MAARARSRRYAHRADAGHCGPGRARAGSSAVGIGKAAEVGQIAPGAPLLVALRSGARPWLPTREFGGFASLHSEPLWLIDRIADLLDEHAQQAPILIAIDDYQ
jgi:hypothetical protein